MRGFGGPRAAGRLLALVIASAAPALAEPAGHVPLLDIRWSLSGNPTRKASTPAPAKADRAKAAESGFQDFLLKPIDPALLRDRLQR